MASFTFTDLVRTTERLNPKTRGKNYPYTPRFEITKYTSGEDRGQRAIVPFVGTKSVLISLKAWGVTQASMHNVTLSFSNVDIQTEDPGSINYFTCIYKGQMYWIEKLDRHKHPLTSRCSCADYFFSWAFSNNKAGCLYGPPPRPFRKKTNRKPRNPQLLPGMCKHVYNAWRVLRDSGLTVN